MVASHKFKIHDWTIKTMVVSSESELKEGLTELLSSIGSDRNTKRVIGLDIERSNDAVHHLSGISLSSSNTKPMRLDSADKAVLLKLSTGCCCLLIRLDKFATPPLALVNLLGIQDVSFVGVGIKFCVEHLVRDHGLRCRNAVDLGQLAAAVRNNVKLGHCGLADLADVMCHLKLDVKAPSVVFSNWKAMTLSPEQIESATSDAFLSFILGNQLLGGFDPPRDRSHSYGYDYDY